MARETPRSGHKNASGRFQGAAEASRRRVEELEAVKATWKRYRATVQVSIRAKDKRMARKALDSVRPLLGVDIDYEVTIEAVEGPEQVS